MRIVALLSVLVIFAGCSADDGENNGDPARIICGSDADCPEQSHCQADGRCLSRTACSADIECPFDAKCNDGKCASALATQSAPGAKTEIDILFVIDNSETMCASQRHLSTVAETLGWNVAHAEIDARFAFVSTDMIDPEHQGAFLRRPGERDLMTCLNPPDTSTCVSLSNGVIKASDYVISSNALSKTLNCMAWVGNTGSSVEMGLETMRRALANPTQAAEFLRPGALLGIVFVSDENDCSDGTFSGSQGSVYARTLADGHDQACELQRNIEDSCPYHKTDHGAFIEHQGEQQNARDWCLEGDRVTVQALATELSPSCPAGGCANGLTPRSEYFDFVTDLVAQKNGFAGNRDAAREDIRVVALVTEDDGVRDDALDAPTRGCSHRASGYRYDLFAGMFPLNTVEEVCRTHWSGNPFDPLTDGADQRICLEQAPAECDPALGENACVGDGACLEQFEWEDHAYYTCTNAVVRVSVDVGMGPQPIPEHTGYRIDYASERCLALTGSPVQLTIYENVFPEHIITVDYVPSR